MKANFKQLQRKKNILHSKIMSVIMSEYGKTIGDAKFKLTKKNINNTFCINGNSRYSCPYEIKIEFSDIIK